MPDPQTPTDRFSGIDRYIGGIGRAANTVAGALIIILMVAQLVVVVLRYVFSLGVPWGQDLLVYLFMLASILPLLLVVWENHSVRVDIFYQGYSVAAKSRLDRFGLLALLLPVSAYAVYTSWGSVINSWQLLEGSPTVGGLPGYFVLKTIQMLVFAGLAIAAALLMRRAMPWHYPQWDDGSPQHSEGE